MKTSFGYCDDGNLVAGDGCSSTCGVEDGWTCTPGSSTTASTCSDFCGDAKKVKSETGKCDDGNTNPNDG